MLQKIELFITSLWLLFLLVFIYTINVPICFEDNAKFIGISSLIKINIIPLICLSLMFLGLIFYFRFDYKIVKSAPNLPQQVKKINDLNYETVAFLVTYIIPLLFFIMDFDIGNTRNLIMFFAILFIIGVIYINTNLFYTNPSLSILGYRIYKVTTEQVEDMVVIIKGKLKLNDFFYPKLIDDNIYFIKKSVK